MRMLSGTTRRNAVLFVGSSAVAGLILVLFLAVDFYRANAGLAVSDTGAAALHESDRQLGWKLKPGATCRHARPGDFDVAYTVDPDGFRLTHETPEPAMTLTFYGDSYTFGHGVADAEAFASVIAFEYVKPEVRVRNAGVEGYGIVQMYQRFLDTCEQLEPGDVVVFSPTSGDLQRNLDDFVFPYTCAFRRGANAMPIEYFPAYENGAVTPVRLERSGWNKLKLLALTAPATRGFWQWAFGLPSQRAMRDAHMMIEDAQMHAEKHGAKFLLIFLPRVSECIKQRYEVDVTDLPARDIMSAFPKDEAALRAMRFKKDSHWNAAGHRMAAAAIVRCLIETGSLGEAHVAENPAVDAGKSFVGEGT